MEITSSRHVLNKVIVEDLLIEMNSSADVLIQELQLSFELIIVHEIILAAVI